MSDLADKERFLKTASADETEEQINVAAVLEDDAKLN